MSTTVILLLFIFFLLLDLGTKAGRVSKSMVSVAKEEPDDDDDFVGRKEVVSLDFSKSSPSVVVNLLLSEKKGMLSFVIL